MKLAFALAALLAASPALADVRCWKAATREVHCEDGSRAWRAATGETVIQRPGRRETRCRTFAGATTCNDR